VAPIGDRRIAIFTAADGHGPSSIPERRRLKAGERVSYDARAARDGRVVDGRDSTVDDSDRAGLS
jgi:hypothetical protein